MQNVLRNETSTRARKCLARSIVLQTILEAADKFNKGAFKRGSL
jgi:hypothetical protein